MTFGHLNLGLSQAGGAPITDLYVWIGGQSNGGQEHTQYSGAGRDAFNAEAATYFSGTVQNRNKAVGGSTRAEWVDGGVLQIYGTAMLTDMAANPPAEGQAVVIRWNWGEQNGADGDSKATIKTELLALFTAWRDEYPTLIIVLDMLGRRTTDVNNGYWQNVKEAYLELIAENAWIYKGAERYDLTLADAQHLNEVGYETQAQRDARTIAGLYSKRSLVGTIGPQISSASIVSPSVIEMALTQDAGTDISPSTGIEGITVAIDGTFTSAPTVTRKDANTVKILLPEGAAPTSAETTVVYSAYGQVLGINNANVLVDNTGMPLRTGLVTASNDDAIMNLDNLKAYFDPYGSAKTYNTGTRIATIAPIGGVVGNGAPITASEGPTYDATAFSNAGGFTFDDVDRELVVGDLGTAGGTWTIGMTWELAATLNYTYYFFGWGASGGATDAQALMFMSNAGAMRYSTNNSNVVETLWASPVAGSKQVFFFEYVSASVLNLYAVVAGVVTLVGTIDPRDDYSAYDYLIFFNSSSSRLAPINDKCGAFFVTNDVLTSGEKTAVFNQWNTQFSLGL